MSAIVEPSLAAEGPARTVACEGYWNGPAVDFGGPRPRPGPAWRLSRSAAVIARLGGRLGAHAQDTPEPVVPVPVLGLVPVPVRGPQFPGLVPEGAAAQHARRALRCRPGVVIVPPAGARCKPAPTLCCRTGGCAALIHPTGSPAGRWRNGCAALIHPKGSPAGRWRGGCAALIHPTGSPAGRWRGGCAALIHPTGSPGGRWRRYSVPIQTCVLCRYLRFASVP